jgi:UDP-glucose 4-epimerase
MDTGVATPSSHAPTALRGCRALVTGGAGFIGSHLVRGLLAAGAEVTALDDLSSGHRDNLPGAGEAFIEASILDGAALGRAIAGCRFVFHEAAMVSVPMSVEDPVRCCEINMTGTERVLEAARRAGVERVVFASSAAVYGDEPSLPCREDAPVDCRSPYAASKAAGESAVAAYGRCYDLSTVSLRYFNIFGPRQDPRSAYAAAIAAFVDALSAGRAPTIFGDGLQTRDFTSVENVVEANLLAATCPRRLAGEVINVGMGSRITLLDAVREIGRALGREVAPVFRDARAGDVRHSVADVTRTREMLGYSAAVGFAEGMRRLVAQGVR